MNRLVLKKRCSHPGAPALIYLKSGWLIGGAFQRERSFALAVAAASTTRPSPDGPRRGQHCYRTNRRDLNCLWRPRGSTHEWHFCRRSTASSCRAAYARPVMHANRRATLSCCSRGHAGRPSRRTWCPSSSPRTGEVERAFFVTRAAGLMAAHTSAFEDGQYVLGEALRFRRAQLSRGCRYVGNHQASSTERYRGCRQISSFHKLGSRLDFIRR